MANNACRTFLQITLFTLALCARPGQAWACGGCFGRPSSTEISEVTGHRMAFAISPERTVLWDQFEYSGAPEEFSWVLPVRPGAYVEIASPDFLDSLDAVTQTRVVSPPVSCGSPSSGSGFACGGMSASSNAASVGFRDTPHVTVVSQETVGPYQTAVLRSDNPTALQDWLTSNGYYIPTVIEPTIEAYVSEGFDFLALRLRPNVGVQQMEPVRVVTPQGAPVLPLRMVAAGVGDTVAITLFVIGDGRYSMPDLPEQLIDEKDLVWDFDTGKSNIDSLRQKALRDMLGVAYIVSFAEPNSFASDIAGPQGLTYFSKPNSPYTYGNFAQLYFSAQGTQCQYVRSVLSQTNYVMDCDASNCLPSQIPAASLACNGKDDISAALIGQRPVATWLTRFDMNLPRTALSQDCTLVKSSYQRPVSPWLQAQKSNGSPCPGGVFLANPSRGSFGPCALGFLFVVTAFHLGRRLARPRLHLARS